MPSERGPGAACGKEACAPLFPLPDPLRCPSGLLLVCSWDSACTPSKAVCRASRYACYAAPAVCAAPRPAPTEDPWAALTQSTHIPRCMHATSHAWAVPGPHLLLAALVLSHYVIDVGQHQGVKLIVLLRRHAMARGAGPQLLQAPVVQGPKLDF